VLQPFEDFESIIPDLHRGNVFPLLREIGREPSCTLLPLRRTRSKFSNEISHLVASIKPAWEKEEKLFPRRLQKAFVLNLDPYEPHKIKHLPVQLWTGNCFNGFCREAIR
jgi:hypothetical protein